MVKAKLYNQSGEDNGSIELNPNVFEIEVKGVLVKQVVDVILANRRQVLADTKDKGEVRGGGKKPWRQKGTGRARHGSIRSPLWKGGGVTFGPTTERNFTKKLNKKQRTKALFMVLSDKAAGNNIEVIEGLNIEEGKTKSLAKLFKKISFTNGLLVLPKMEINVVRAISNLPGVNVITANSLNVYDSLNAKKVLFVKEALPEVEKFIKK